MSPRPLCCLALFIALLPAAGFAAVRSVPGTYPTIQSAINASSLGDVIEIAPGTYHERLLITAARDGIIVRGLGGAAVTVVDADALGTTVVLDHVGALTRLEGLTVRGGFVPGAGGGMNLDFASPVVTDCVIEGNQAYAAGGVYVDRGSAPQFVRCVVRNNQAPNGSGGGVYVDHGGQPSLAYCQVYGNTCAAFGGGVTVWEGSLPALDHCTLAGNGGAMAGGNLYLTRLGHAYATNSVFAFPAAGANLEAASDAAASVFACCDLFVDAGVNVAGMPSPVGANGNIALDPQFCDRNAWNFGLSASSPCAAANSACQQIGALDVQCAPVPVAGVTWGSLKSRYR